MNCGLDIVQIKSAAADGRTFNLYLIFNNFVQMMRKGSIKPVESAAQLAITLEITIFNKLMWVDYLSQKL